MRRALSSGFCNLHDPERIKAITKSKEIQISKRKRIDEILTIVTDTCISNGWSYTIDNIDEKEFLSACLSVSKRVPPAYEEITALINIQLKKDKSFTFQIEKTSFHNYGIKALLDALSAAFENKNCIGPQNAKSNDTMYDDNLLLLSTVFKNFYQSTLQLLDRHDSRETLHINDEYDLQDYLFPILKLHYKDIRIEEFSPSRSGANSRIDFLLFNENIIIETKMTKKQLTDKLIGEQLIIDKDRYKAHPKCKKILCFVYDPNHYIKNPIGLETDLEEVSNSFEFRVFIYPK